MATPEKEKPAVPKKEPLLKRRAFLIATLGGAAAGVLSAMLMPREWLVTPAQKAIDPHAGHVKGGEKTYYACPMLCVRAEKPGECPVCGMTLERFVDTGEVLPLDARASAAAGIRTETPKFRQLAREIRTLGSFEVDESVDRRVSAWVSGRIDRLYADYTGIAISEGDHLFDLYSPDLYTAHRELKIAQEAVVNKTPGGEKLLELSREKLRRLGLTIEAIALLEEREATSATFTIPSPASGIVLEKMANQGQYVEAGMPVYRIADLSHLWLILSVHERDLPFVALGQRVEVEVTGLAKGNFHGRVSFIEPVLDAMSRTSRVRVEVPNVAGRLKPGMFGTATIYGELAADGTLALPPLRGEYACPMHPLQRSDAPGACPICGMALKKRIPGVGKSAGKILAVPREAVLSTGKRNLIYVEWWAKRGVDGAVSHDHSGNAELLERPEYQGFEVRLGPLASEFMDMPDGTKMKTGDYYPVLEGLPTGIRVVTNGQFLIDSQQELAGKPSLFRPKGGSSAGAHSGH